MKELDVIVDIRPSEDSPDFVVVKRKVSAKDGELVVSGEPVESKISLLTPRLRVKLERFNDPDLGESLVAHVQNTGFVPLSAIAVAFWDHYIPPVPGTVNGAQEKIIGNRTPLIPRHRRMTASLLPGETSEWHLIKDPYQRVVTMSRVLPTDQYDLLVFSGDKEVARVRGEEIKKVLEPARRTEPWFATSRARMILKGMAQSEANEIGLKINTFATIPPEQWPSDDAILLDEDQAAYLLKISPTLRAFVRLQPDGSLELDDLMSQDTLNHFLQYLEKSGAKE